MGKVRKSTLRLSSEALLEAYNLLLGDVFKTLTPNQQRIHLAAYNKYKEIRDGENDEEVDLIIELTQSKANDNAGIRVLTTLACGVTYRVHEIDDVGTETIYYKYGEEDADVFENYEDMLEELEENNGEAEEAEEEEDENDLDSLKNQYLTDAGIKL